MKKYIFILLIAVSLLISCGKKTTIEGTVSNADSSNLVLENFNAGKPIKIDKKVLNENGKFSFTTDALDTTEIYNLILDENRMIRLVVKPEEHIVIKADKENFGENYEVNGSEESELLSEAEKKLAKTRSDLNKLRKQYKNSNSQEEKRRLEKAYEDRFKEHYEYLRHFVFDNAPSLVSYLSLYQRIDSDTFVFSDLNDDKYVRAVAQKMKTAHPNSPYLPLLVKELDRRTLQKQNAKISSLMKSSKNSYPDLNMSNDKGEEVSLKALDAKYILLYFGILNENSKSVLLPIYNKYNDRGLEIYFVDENPNIKVWKEAVSDLKTPWINVHEDGLASNLYNVNKIPTNFIIEVDGTIVGKNLYNNYLTEKLNKLLH